MLQSELNIIRNIVYEILMSVFTPCMIVLTFVNVTNNKIPPPQIDQFQFMVLVSLLAFIFPVIGSVIWTVCVLINALVIYVRVQMKCKTDWDCRSANDLFHQYFPFDR
jgi:hypothetical protein